MNTSSSGWIIAAAAAAAAIFVLDLFLPLGIAVPMLYVLPILFSWMVPGGRITSVMAGCCVVLTMLGTVLSPGDFTTAVAADRALASTLELVIAWLVVRQKQSAGQIAEAQRARDESEERLRLAVEGGDLGSWDVDVRAGYTVWSRRHAIMLGCEPDNGAVSLQTWKDRVHPNDLQRVMAAVEWAKRERRLFAVEHRVVLPDKGKERWLSLYGRFFYDETGEPVRCSGVSLDITERKQAEEALRQKQRELQTSQAQLQDLTAKLFTAQDDERQRIARDLHDDFSQRLAALTIDLHRLSSRPPELDSERSHRLTQLSNRAEQIATDLQRLAHQLHSSLLEHAGLEAAVREHAEEFEARTGLKTKVVVRNLPAALSLDCATCLYRVLQESLQNVRKHADATHVLVRLLGTTRGAGLCVQDDGRGFDVTPEVSGGQQGLGLISLHERTGTVHGTFRVKSKRGEGTEVHAWVPLDPHKVSEDVGAGR